MLRVMCIFQHHYYFAVSLTKTGFFSPPKYALISHRVCERVPDQISSVDAVALASASPAILLAERIREGERVLILGAGGGVGSHTVQLMKARGASFIAGASRTPDRLLKSPLNYNRAIDYTKDDVFSLDEFKEDPFDVILDLAGGGWVKLNKDYTTGSKSIIKPASSGGRFLTVTPDEAIFEIHSIPGALKLFLWIPLWRAIKSRLWGRRKLPAYTFAMSLPGDREVMTKTMQLAADGTVKAVVDTKGKKRQKMLLVFTPNLLLAYFIFQDRFLSQQRAFERLFTYKIVDIFKAR